jgi:hypothetical protein
MPGNDAGSGRANAGSARQVADLRKLRVRREGRDRAVGAGAGGSPGAVQVRLVLRRWRSAV